MLFDDPDFATLLEGGNITGEVLLCEGRVHRSSHHRSAYVAELLDELNRLGFSGCPPYLGRDRTGRDVFGFIPGETHLPCQRRTPENVARGAVMLRQLHQLTRGHRLAAGGECVIHGDAGPWNCVFDHVDQPLALIDWDIAAPGRALTDIAYFAWTWAVPAQPQLPLTAEAKLLRSARDAYDPDLPAEVLLDAMVASQERGIAWARDRLADSSLPAVAHEHAADSGQWSQQCRAHVRQHRAVLLDALR